MDTLDSAYNIHWCKGQFGYSGYLDETPKLKLLQKYFRI